MSCNHPWLGMRCQLCTTHRFCPDILHSNHFLPGSMGRTPSVCNLLHPQDVPLMHRGNICICCNHPWLGMRCQLCTTHRFCPDILHLNHQSHSTHWVQDVLCGGQRHFLPESMGHTPSVCN